MKIAIISDIHKDYNEFKTGEDMTSLYVTALKKQDIDILIVAGDVAEDLLEVKSFLEDLRQALGIVVLYVPGNHEMWQDGSKDTMQRYMEFENIQGCLSGKPYVINEEWAIIGDMGWYDYGYRPEYVTEELAKMQKKKVWRNEYQSINLKVTDPEFTEYFVDKLKRQIEIFKDKKVIFVNHFVLFEDFLTYKEGQANWNFANAYMGSKMLGDVVLAADNVKVAIFGHTHKRFGICDYMGKKVICNPLGYKSEWWPKVTKEQVEKSIIILDLEGMAGTTM